MSLLGDLGLTRNELRDLIDRHNLHCTEDEKLKHSPECRSQNGKGKAFVCCCDFFDRVRNILGRKKA